MSRVCIEVALPAAHPTREDDLVVVILVVKLNVLLHSPLLDNFSATSCTIMNFSVVANTKIVNFQALRGFDALNLHFPSARGCNPLKDFAFEAVKLRSTFEAVNDYGVTNFWTSSAL